MSLSLSLVAHCSKSLIVDKTLSLAQVISLEDSETNLAKMIYNVQVLVVIFVLLAVTAKAFQIQSSRMSNVGSMRMALSDFREELAKTAAAIAAPGKWYIINFVQQLNTLALTFFYFFIPGKGILAVDESTKTIGKRLQSIGIDNTEENRQTYRGLSPLYYHLLPSINLIHSTEQLIPIHVHYFFPGLLFSAPGLGKYISGAILYEETLFQSSKEGTPFVDLLKSNGLFPGIKVDTGLQPLPGADPIETWYLSLLLHAYSCVSCLEKQCSCAVVDYLSPRELLLMFLLSGALVLTASRSALLLTTPKALDSPSGEPSFRSLLMAAHLPSHSRRTPGDLLDTLVPCRSQVRHTHTQCLFITLTSFTARRLNVSQFWMISFS